MTYTFIDDILLILFDICKERYINASILWGFVKQFIEININNFDFSRIPNEWSELHVEKNKQLERATRAENLKKNALLT